jgi:hypothetical protein
MLTASEFTITLPTAQEALTWLSVIATAAAAGLAARLRVSKVETAVIKQKAEGDLYEQLTNERDKALEDAREAWSTRTADAQAIARMTEREIALREEIARLRDDFERFTRLMVRHFPGAADFLPSRPADLPR